MSQSPSETPSEFRGEDAPASVQPVEHSPLSWGGLVSRRERWGFTLKGWLALFALAASFLVFAILTVHPFLSITAPVVSDTLVVEGWISQVGIKQSAREISSTNYRHAFITGGPISGFGGYTSDFNTYAHYGFSRLLKQGVAAKKMTRVPCRVTERDRTYSSAVALREYFRSTQQHPASINVITDAVHARRSRLLFQAALGPEIKVGIIAVAPTEYQADRWWQYSAGVKDVFSEGMAYTYARIFF